MITREELHILMQESTRQAINANIERAPHDIALDKRIDHAALVATQVKYLQRARRKLPSYYEARCIIPSLAFEQSSSEATASTKRICGESLLELTCGLGVDTLYLAKRFEKVVTIERDEVLAEVGRENFRRLGANNISVVTGQAEEYLEGCDTTFDWIYADPARRGNRGEKLFRLEDCSPNILALRQRLESLTRQGFMIKCSPLFDIDEGFRLFEGADIEVVSSHDECKEVVIIVDKSEPQEHIITTISGAQSHKTLRAEIDNHPTHKEFDPQKYSWLILPNVALQKSRTAIHTLRPVADIWDNNGFGFSIDKPNTQFGREFEIVEVVDFQPKSLNKRLAKQGVEIIKRGFGASTSALKFKAGADILLGLTTIEGRHIAIFLKR